MSTDSSTIASQPTVGIKQINFSSRSQTMLQSIKVLYQATQQVKFLHLQAEVESLLQELQLLKQQRLAADSYAASENH